MTTNSKLSASLEDYLETIYGIEQKKHAARSKDIASKLGVNSSSVTGALHSLRDKKLINYAPYDIITLTPKGKKIAKNIFNRHTVLRDFFISVLGVDFESAEQSACKMEHSISKVILERLTNFVEFIKKCPRTNIGWSEDLGYFCDNTDTLEDCERCISKCLDQIKDKKREKERINE
jgi:DtxR family Mn-dependent transcriptional regulator